MIILETFQPFTGVNIGGKNTTKIKSTAVVDIHFLNNLFFKIHET